MSEQEQTYLVIADDHELHVALKGSFFERAGFVFHNIGAREDVFAVIRKLRPVMAIMALDMYGQKGDHICRRVKDDPALRSTPIALIARYEDEEERGRCHESGCDEILRRPLNDKQILAASYRMLKVLVDRFEFRSIVQLEGTCGEDDTTRRSCIIRNLSGSGAFIETGKLRPVGSEVVLEFTLPGHEDAISCRGRVAWLNHPEWSKKPQLPVGFGVQFDDMPPAARMDIDEYVHSGR